MAEIGHSALTTTIITVEEQIQGRFQVIKRALAGEKLVSAYADLQNTIGYFAAFQILPFNLLQMPITQLCNAKKYG